MDISRASAASTIKPLENGLSLLLSGSNRPVIVTAANIVPLSEANIAELLRTLPANSSILQQLVKFNEQRSLNTAQSTSLPVLAKLIKELATQLTSPSSAVNKSAWVLLDKPVQEGAKLLVQVTAAGAKFKTFPPDIASTINNQIPIKVATKDAAAEHVNSLIKPSETPLLNNAQRRYLPVQDPTFTLLKQAVTHTPAPRPELFTLANRSELPLLPRLAHTISLFSQFTKNLPSLDGKPLPNIRQIVANSGVFLENTLAAKIASSAPSAASPNQNDTEDIKHVALVLLATVRQALTAASDPKTFSENKTLDALVRLLFSHTQTSPQAQIKQENMQFQLRTLENIILGVVARISTNQLNSLQTSNEQNTLINIQTDLPFRHMDTFFPIHFRLYEVKEKNADKKQSKHKRSWRVLLEWEFPEYGKFSSEIQVTDNKLSSTISTDNPIIRERLKHNLNDLFEQLEKEGIQINELRCSELMPKAAKTTLQTPLIDVRT